MPSTACSRTDLIDSLPGDMLTKVDLMSMAHSLEVRVPLLDHRVVELAFRIPGAEKLRGGVTKRVLKEAFENAAAAGSHPAGRNPGSRSRSAAGSGRTWGSWSTATCPKSGSATRAFSRLTSFQDLVRSHREGEDRHLLGALEPDRFPAMAGRACMR